MHGFTAPREATIGGETRGSDPGRGRGGDHGHVGSVDRSLSIRRDGKARTNALTNVGLPRLVLVRIVRHKRGGRHGLLWNIGRWNYDDVAGVQPSTRRRLALALLLEGRDERRKNSLDLSLEMLGDLSQQLVRELHVRSDAKVSA